METQRTFKVEIPVSAKDVLEILKSLPVEKSVEIITAFLGDDNAWKIFQKEIRGWE